MSHAGTATWTSTWVWTLKRRRRRRVPATESAVDRPLTTEIKTTTQRRTVVVVADDDDVGDFEGRRVRRSETALLDFRSCTATRTGPR